MTYTTRLLIAAVVTVTFMPASQSQAVMVGRWTLDDGAAGLQNLGTDGATSDLTAPAASASISGGPTYTASGGTLGGYATFDGNQALIANAAGNAADDLTGYPFTMSAWIRPSLSHLPANRGAAVGMSYPGSSANIYYTVGYEANNNATDNNDVQAVRRNTTFTSTEGTSTAATAFNGSWHHIAVVNASDTSSRLYLDGVQVGSSSTAVTFANTVNTITIGAFLRQAGYIDKYVGDIDEVQIYNDALIASQIQYLYTNIVGPAPPVAACDVDLANGCTVADLQIIANNFFTSVTDRSQGDLNSDGVVNFADYRIWKDASGSSATLESLGVPEPSAILLIALALPWLGLRRAAR